MSNNEGQVKRIHAKLHQVLKQHALLQKENILLKEELKSAKQLLTVQQDDIEGMRQQVAVLKYSNAEMTEVDKKEFEKKINTYVKEIDKCISMLSQ